MANAQNQSKHLNSALLYSAPCLGELVVECCAWGSCWKGNSDCLLCFRILSLACSPSGASFVCSAAAQSPISHMDFSAVSSGGKSMNQVPGKLLLWDTKMMKQQVLVFLSQTACLEWVSSVSVCRSSLSNLCWLSFQYSSFSPLPAFPSVTCRRKMNSVSSFRV